MTRIKGMTVGELAKELQDIPADAPVAVNIDDRHSLLDTIVLHGGKKGFRVTLKALQTDVDDTTVQRILPVAEPVVKPSRTPPPLPPRERKYERIILLDTDQRTKIGETEVEVEHAGVLPETIDVAGTAFIHRTGREYRLARTVKVAAERRH